MLYSHKIPQSVKGVLYVTLGIPFEINEYENLQNPGVNESERTTLAKNASQYWMKQQIQQNFYLQFTIICYVQIAVNW